MIISSKKYVDLPFFISKNPFTNDLNVVKDSQVIKQNMKNLIFTAPGERPFNHNLGSGANDLYTIDTNNIQERVPIIYSLYRSILNNDSRIENLDIKYTTSGDINISFSEKNTNLFNELSLR